MIEAGMYLIGAHEPSHSFIRRPDDQERFGGMYTYMNEMYATVLGLAIVGARDDIDDDTKNRILAVHFATTADAYAQRGDPTRRDYLLGFASIFNTLIEERVITIDNEGRIRWDDHRPIFQSFIRSSQEKEGLENLITYGTKEMALRLRQADGHFRNLQLLRPFREKQQTNGDESPPNFLRKPKVEEPNGDPVNLIPGS